MTQSPTWAGALRIPTATMRMLGTDCADLHQGVIWSLMMTERVEGDKRLCSRMVDEGLHDGVTEISFSAMFRERMKSMPPEVRDF